MRDGGLQNMLIQMVIYHATYVLDSSIELNYGNMRNCVVKQVSLKLSRSKEEEFKLLPHLFYHAKDNHHKGALRL